jgi:hypothetical protein
MAPAAHARRPRREFQHQYRRLMARGWESKSVEAQQDAAGTSRPAGPAVTPQEAARRSERATLMLARSRAMADLQQACAAAHRAMLESAIADLDKRIAAIDEN